jgi:hypothetical protein
MHFRSSPEKWSISQCIEHIVLTEKMLFEMNFSELKKTNNPERKEEVKIMDKEILEVMEDRSKKFKADESLIGKGKYNHPLEALTEFKEQR